MNDIFSEIIYMLEGAYSSYRPVVTVQLYIVQA